MTARVRARAAGSSSAARPGVAPAFALVESKLVAPPRRPGLVERERLVKRLDEAEGCSVIAVVAPAGYGKSTLLTKWAAQQPRLGWVSLDEHDNDPAVLLTYLAVAVDRIEPIDVVFGRWRAPTGVGIADVVELVSAIASMGDPIALVLDQAEAITSRSARDVIAELAMTLPEGSRLAIGSRHDVPAPIARLRAQRALFEIGAPDLEMDRVEAGELLARAGVAAPEDAVDDLHQRTEGWAAGLYLAALALSAGGGGGIPAGSAFTGDDRFMGDYLRSEFLSNASRADVSFLTRTSILERLSGPLCDAVTGREHSERVLDRLEQHNRLIVPLDRRREWYRYHHLFRELLRSELTRRETTFVPALHARAAVWFEEHDQPEVAIDHAQWAGDADRVARLVLRIANPVWASGRVDTVVRWTDWFSTNDLVDRYPAIAVHGALLHALVGDPGGAERWAAAAERGQFEGTLPDGNTMEGTLAYLRTLLCRDGLDVMRQDADRALGGLTATSPYRPAMLHATGAAYLLQHDLDAADVWFERALHEATSAGVTPFVPVMLAERGIVASARERWGEADALAARALDQMDGGRFDDYWTSALVYAWAATVMARRSDIAQARELASRAARLRPLLTYALPVMSAQALLELARAYIALGDRSGGRAVLRQLQDILQQRPELGAIDQQAGEQRSRLDALGADMLGVSSFTTAELRLLPMLLTHLSLGEIGERLFVSRNTVKSHTRSIYRKLGVTSRGETINKMLEVGVVSGS